MALGFSLAGMDCRSVGCRGFGVGANRLRKSSAGQRIADALRALVRRLGYVERWLLISLISALVGSLFIGVFYVMERVVVALSAMALGSGGHSMLGTSDFSLIALVARRRILLPLIAGLGALLSALIVYNLEPEAEGGGTDAAVHAFHERAGIIRPRVALVKAVASALLLGTGGSAGPEGPAIQIGASAGSSIARLLRLSVEERKIMLVSGMAAALSFIFRSPVGSAIFAIEVLYMSDMEISALIPALFSSIIAYALSIHILGPGYELPSLSLRGILPLYSASALASYIVAGLMIAPFSYLYIMLYRIVKNRIKPLLALGRPWIPPVISVTLVGIIAVYVPYIAGTGEETLAHMLEDFQRGRVLLLAGPLAKSAVASLLVLAALKVIATALTVGSGGSGGLLAPGIFAGAMVGEAVGLLLGRFSHLNPAIYAYIGMAALFGSASKVSIGLSFFVAEIAGTPALVVPALLATLTASLTLGSESIVESQLPHRVPPHVFTVRSLLEVLRKRKACVRVGEFVIRAIPAVHREELLSKVVKRIISHGIRVIPVIDENGKIVGVVDSGYAGLDIRFALHSREKVSSVSLREAPIIYVNECIDKALEEMIIYGTDYAIVVGSDRRYIGMLLLEDIVNALLPLVLEEVKREE